ncbi:MAG: GspE/PulE family protein [Gammaproteobacteria bacterium]
MFQRIKLGDLLVNHNIITQEQLTQAIEHQKQTGEKLGRALISLNFVNEQQILDVLSEQLNIPYVDLGDYELNFEVSRLLPEAFARRYHAVLLKEEQDAYLVGMADPLDINAIDQLRRTLKKHVNYAIVSESSLDRTLDLIYRRTEQISTYATQLDQEIGANISALDDEQAAAIQDAPVVKLLNSMFEDAVQIGASDIHIEPGESELRIRLRIDGVLHEQVMRQKQIAHPMASRLKLMSGLNIAESRLPQDGRFDINVAGRTIDVRLSTLPTPFGESIVMRLLDQSAGQLNLNEVGMTPDVLERFRELIKHPHGIILVTGPTGSGKSTTLYGALSELNQAKNKIITAEDPIEYRLPRIIQVQTNEKLQLTFSRILRTALRQDPDIVMVGEMRDNETATVAIRAALTGHLVLSTLHTNDAASSAFRLVDMGVEGFLVAATLRGVVAQRLVRRICEHCREEAAIGEVERAWLEAVSLSQYANSQFYKGHGCSYCNQSGYRGRMAVVELLELNEEMKNALRMNDAALFSQAATKKMEGHLMVNNALQAALNGVTSMSEVLRIIGE